ncbi:hypothetical protein [Williamsia sterculiae]|uniref:DUF4232 domain-containing protein n=1 Tax=Williamsia sterculiae TaxID=1344003 RepID=A0A1N7CT33_9NOCA|nr:hypothetical protein [Williamsia sterculiae]SIR66762.1 hypothetical protein SAMN05445060_0348 [Williamsia sterculiae]
MLEPQGPLPPEIYWRRRALAVGVLVVVVAVVVGIILLATSGGSSPKNANASSDQTSVAPLPSASAPPSSSGGYGEGGYGGSPGGSTAASASAVPGQTGQAGSGGGGNGAAVTPAPVPASGLCPDQNISVVLYTDKPTYAVGDQPVFTLVVTNAGLAECTRDVGKDMQNVVVRTLDKSYYIWSATDCAPISEVNNQVLKPAQQFKDTITWSANTSNPGCTNPRKPVGPGSYQAVGKIGEKESAPITFNVVQAATNPGA